LGETVQIARAPKPPNQACSSPHSCDTWRPNRTIGPARTTCEPSDCGTSEKPADCGLSESPCRPRGPVACAPANMCESGNGEAAKADMRACGHARHALATTPCPPLHSPRNHPSASPLTSPSPRPVRRFRCATAGAWRRHGRGGGATGAATTVEAAAADGGGDGGGDGSNGGGGGGRGGGGNDNGGGDGGGAGGDSGSGGSGGGGALGVDKVKR
jgi:hypothetical protein